VPTRAAARGNAARVEIKYQLKRIDLKLLGIGLSFFLRPWYRLGSKRKHRRRSAAAEERDLSVAAHLVSAGRTFGR
jgi:uncharacterized protein YcaQ